MNKLLKQIEKLGLKHLFSSLYRSQTNKERQARTKCIASLLSKPEPESNSGFKLIDDAKLVDRDGNHLSPEDIHAFNLKGNSIEFTLSDEAKKAIGKSRELN